MGKIQRRSDWEDNHLLIDREYFKLLEKNKRVPTFKQLSEATNLSINTIEAHLKELDLKKLRQYFKPMSIKVLTKLGHEALKTGRAAEVKLFMQLIHDSETSQLNDSVSEVKITIVK